MFGSFYQLSISLGIVISLISLRKNSGRERFIQKVIVFILLWVLVLESIGNYTASRGINNSALYNFGFIFLESFMLIYYFSLIETSLQFKKKVWIFCGLFILWGFINSYLFQPITLEFQFFSFLPFALLILFLAIRFLIRVMQMKVYAQKNLIRLPHFWISWVVIIFYLEALCLFGSYQFYPSFVLDNVTFLFSVNQIIAGLMYVTFGLAFLFPSFTSNKLPLA